ncbi:GGDEF domain-containing protein [Nitrosomonas supralitoralis]|uniref:Diguanylate cyclase n=1 Tax=Nitrosomonas supralitoralis TaxID=2116706 RepID=A0A2P7NZI5_9PROT|nr:GGDEF domain-containing protein [Nitrosomonas supralitoralis]PSJ18879.1 diguanylate cyclase [Nitrosomonas supralitoralis]
MKTDSYKALTNYIDLLLDAICVVDKDGRFEFVSASAERIFGYTSEEMLGRSMIELVHPDDRKRTLQTASEINNGVIKVDFENRYIRKDGQTVHLLWSARRSQTDQRRIAVARDITKIKQTEARQTALFAISEAAFAAEDLLALYRSIHQIITCLMPAQHFAIALLDNEHNKVHFPYSTIKSSIDEIDIAILCDEVIRSGETLLVIPDNQAEQPSALQKIVAGTMFNWLSVPLKSHQAIIGTLILQNDINKPTYSTMEIDVLEFVSTQIALAIERKQMLARLQQMALYDRLTGLPNRELFHDRMQSALARSRRDQGILALLYLDLDKFKQINDECGHSEGDLLLRQAAQRMQTCLRQTDTIARFGGDEFVILLEHIDNDSVVSQIAEKIRLSLQSSFTLINSQRQILPSIGIALFPRHGTDEQHLLRQADKAMYVVKKNGGNAVHFAD